MTSSPSPAYVVIKAANEFKDKTTAINQLWQTEFTYLWGWYYLSTVLDDFSRYIVAWRLGPTMCASDVTAMLDQALTAWALITSPLRTGRGCSATMARLMLQGICHTASDTRACSTCEEHRISRKPRARSSAGT